MSAFDHRPGSAAAGLWDTEGYVPEQSTYWSKGAIQETLGYMNSFHDTALSYQMEELDRNPASSLDEKNRRAQGARMVAASYGHGNENHTDNLRDPVLPVDLSTPGKRLEFLDGYIQNFDDMDTRDDHSCGPAAMIGGAILAKGPEGLKTLLDAVGTLDPNGAKNELIEEIKQRIAAGEPISPMDLHDAQTYVYDTFKGKERRDAKAEFDKQGEARTPEEQAKREEELARMSVNGGTMAQLLQNNTELRSMFQDSGMEIAGIDLGERNGEASDHFVLMVKGTDGAPMMVYDPWSKEKGQITARPHDWSSSDFYTYDSQLRDYENATRFKIG